MGNKFARLGGDPKRHKRVINGRSKLSEIRRGFHAAPQNTRAPLIREKTEATELHLNGRSRMDRCKGCANGLEFFCARFADKLQGDVHCFGADPFGGSACRLQACNEFAERVAHFVRKIESHKKTHDSGPAVRGE